MRLIHIIILIFASYFIIRFLKIREERKLIMEDSGGWIYHKKKLLEKGIIIDEKNNELIRIVDNKKIKSKTLRIADLNSIESTELCNNKLLSQKKLSDLNLPICNFKEYVKEDKYKISKELNYPLVVKPCCSLQGMGVKINIISEDELIEHLNNIDKKNEKTNYIIEEQSYGTDFRILIFNDRIVGAIKKEKPHIIGDGESSVKKLLNKSLLSLCISFISTAIGLNPL